MATYQMPYGSTLAYNVRSSWMRYHDTPYWSLVNDETINSAVIDDFGHLVIVHPWGYV